MVHLRMMSRPAAERRITAVGRLKVNVCVCVFVCVCVRLRVVRGWLRACACEHGVGTKSVNQPAINQSRNPASQPKTLPQTRHAGSLGRWQAP